jgi:hypothetical protein
MILVFATAFFFAIAFLAGAILSIGVLRLRGTDRGSFRRSTKNQKATACTKENRALSGPV